MNTTFNMPKPMPIRYGVPTAVTFFLAGLGFGSFLTLIFARRADDQPSFPSTFGTRSKAESPAL